MRGVMTTWTRTVFVSAAAGLMTPLFALTAIAQDAGKPAPSKPAPAAAAPAAPAAGTPQAGGSGWSAEVAGGTSGISLDEKQTAIVKQVTGYFLKLENLKGSFVQTGADKKRMRGKFYVKRPGRFRFDYALPSKQIIISDGESLAVQDLDINTEDRVSLDQTAFRLLLRQDIDLIRDAKITEIQAADDLIVLALQDKSPDAPGRIKLFFATKPDLEIKEWVTLDAQGLETRVEVSELNKTEQIDAGLFKIQPVGLSRTTPQ